MGDAQLGRRPTQRDAQDFVADLLSDRRGRRRSPRPIIQADQAFLGEAPLPTPPSAPCSPPDRRSPGRSTPERTATQSGHVGHPELPHHGPEHAVPTPHDQAPRPPKCAPDSACTIVPSVAKKLKTDTRHDTSGTARVFKRQGGGALQSVSRLGSTLPSGCAASRTSPRSCPHSCGGTCADRRRR